MILESKIWVKRHSGLLQCAPKEQHLYDADWVEYHSKTGYSPIPGDSWGSSVGENSAGTLYPTTWPSPPPVNTPLPPAYGGDMGVFIDGKFVPWIKDDKGNIIGLDPSNRQVTLTPPAKVDKPVPKKSGRKFR